MECSPFAVGGADQCPSISVKSAAAIESVTEGKSQLSGRQSAEQSDKLICSEPSRMAGNQLGDDSSNVNRSDDHRRPNQSPIRYVRSDDNSDLADGKQDRPNLGTSQGTSGGCKQRPKITRPAHPLASRTESTEGPRPVMINTGKYSKFIVSLQGVAATALTTFTGPSYPHWVPTAIGALSAVLVYLVPNQTPASAVVIPPASPTSASLSA
ncbi:MAG: hypothetical protein ACREHG_04170, partial [Candidatus Saccharimonadales bacterium]